MMVYKYSLHDPDSGKVLYEGTAADLAAQGVVVSEKVLPTLWRDQQRKTRRHWQAPVGRDPGKGGGGLQPESLQGATEAEKDGERPGKAAEEAHKAEGGRRTDAETGGTQEAPGAAEEVPGRP